MLAQVTSCAVVGLEGALVQVEVDVSNGGPYFSIVGEADAVGLPDAAVQEARERVRSAARAKYRSILLAILCDAAWRAGGETGGARHATRGPISPATNASPSTWPRADAAFRGRKEGPAYDLPMALALVMASGGANPDLDGAMVVGAPLCLLVLSGAAGTECATAVTRSPNPMARSPWTARLWSRCVGQSRNTGESTSIGRGARSKGASAIPTASCRWSRSPGSPG